jgi:hypothetical protein
MCDAMGSKPADGAEPGPGLPVTKAGKLPVPTSHPPAISSGIEKHLDAMTPELRERVETFVTRKVATRI